MSEFALVLAADFLQQIESTVRRVFAERAKEAPAGWLNVQRAGEYLGGMTPQAIYSMVREQKIVPYRPNGPGTKPLLFSREQLDAWVRGDAV